MDDAVVRRSNGPNVPRQRVCHYLVEPFEGTALQ